MFRQWDLDEDICLQTVVYCTFASPAGTKGRSTGFLIQLAQMPGRREELGKAQKALSSQTTNTRSSTLHYTKELKACSNPFTKPEHPRVWLPATSNIFTTLCYNLLETTLGGGPLFFSESVPTP